MVSGALAKVAGGAEADGGEWAVSPRKVVPLCANLRPRNRPGVDAWAWGGSGLCSICSMARGMLGQLWPHKTTCPAHAQHEEGWTPTWGKQGKPMGEERAGNGMAAANLQGVAQGN